MLIQNRKWHLWKKINLTKNETNSTSIHDYTFVVLEKLYLKQNDKFNAYFSKSYQLFLDIAVFDLELLENLEYLWKIQKSQKSKNILLQNLVNKNY